LIIKSRKMFPKTWSLAGSGKPRQTVLLRDCEIPASRDGTKKEQKEKDSRQEMEQSAGLIAVKAVGKRSIFMSVMPITC
jgi:hypothetical protein